MNGIQISAIVLLIFSIAVLCLCGTPKRSKYLVTYEALLTVGGWTHGEAILTTKSLSSKSLNEAREWVRSNRTDITEGVCIMSVVKLDE